MKTVRPQEHQMENAVKSIPRGIPVVMLNLLRFREVAKYDAGSENERITCPEKRPATSTDTMG